MTTVILADGKLELPGSVRTQLDLRDGATLELEVTGQGILLRPTDDLGEEEVIHIHRGIADIAAGRVRNVSEEELLALIDPVDSRNRRRT